MFFAFGDYYSHPGRLGSKPHSNDISRGSILCACCEAIPSPSLSHRMDLSSGSASRTKSFERPEEICKIWTTPVVGELILMLHALPVQSAQPTVQQRCCC